MDDNGESHNAYMNLYDAHKDETTIAIVETIAVLAQFWEPTQLWMMNLKNLLYRHKLFPLTR